LWGFGEDYEAAVWGKVKVKRQKEKVGGCRCFFLFLPFYFLLKKPSGFWGAEGFCGLASG
jgi:hypothetical protein